MAPRVAWDWKRYVGKLAADPGAAKHYLFNGAPPNEGDVIRFPALAATLKTIAAKGARAFYEGAIAEDMAATLARARLVPDGGGFRQSSRRSGDADLDQLSRARSGRDPAQRAGPHRAGDAQHPGEFRSRRARSDRARALPSGAGGGALGLCGARHAYRRACAYARDGRRSARQKLCQKTRRQNRPEQARQAAVGADARQRHDLSHRGRPRPHGGVLHQFALFELRHRHLHREDRHHVQQSRLLFRARARASERRSGPASGRCTPSFRRWPCATAAAT